MFIFWNEFVYLFQLQLMFETSRERHNSAPYLRLKNSKRTSKCQVFFYSAWKKRRLDRIGALKGVTFSKLLTSILQNTKQREKGLFGKNFRNKPHNAENWKRGHLVSPGIVCHEGKKEKRFWLRSLCLMVQFDTIKFGGICRTILVNSSALKKESL